MFPRVTGVRHVEGYQLHLTFADGTSRTLDFGPRVRDRGGVFEPLEVQSYFAQVALDSEAGTIVWPNGVDFCPDVLYRWATTGEISPVSTPVRSPGLAG